MGRGGGGRGLAFWLSCVQCFLVFCGFRECCPWSGTVWCLIVSIPDLCILPYFRNGIRVSGLTLVQTVCKVITALDDTSIQRVNYSRCLFGLITETKSSCSGEINVCSQTDQGEFSCLFEICPGFIAIWFASLELLDFITLSYILVLYLVNLKMIPIIYSEQQRKYIDFL